MVMLQFGLEYWVICIGIVTNQEPFLQFAHSSCLRWSEKAKGLRTSCYENRAREGDWSYKNDNSHLKLFRACLSSIARKYLVL